MTCVNSSHRHATVQLERVVAIVVIVGCCSWTASWSGGENLSRSLSLSLSHLGTGCGLASQPDSSTRGPQEHASAASARSVASANAHRL